MRQETNDKFQLQGGLNSDNLIKYYWNDQTYKYAHFN